MDGKTVILSVFIICLVMTQSQGKADCPPTQKMAKDNCLACMMLRAPEDVCDIVCACIRRAQNSGNSVNEYCKLGCASSVCGPLNTLLKSDASEVVNGAVEKCNNACSTFCTKGSKIAVKTA